MRSSENNWWSDNLVIWYQKSPFLSVWPTSGLKFSEKFWKVLRSPDIGVQVFFRPSEILLGCVTSMPTLTHLLLAPMHLLFAPTSLLPTPTYLLFAPTHLLPTLTYLLLAPTYILPTLMFLLRTPTLFLRSIWPTSVIPSGTYPVSFLSLTCHPGATYSFHVFTPFMCFLLSCVSPTLPFTCLVFITRIQSFQLVYKSLCISLYLSMNINKAPSSSCFCLTLSSSSDSTPTPTPTPTPS